MRTFTLTNGRITARISDYGAKILSLEVPTADGDIRDVVLGFNTNEEWLTQEPYFNAVIGRYAGRIRGAQFTLDGHTYPLAANNGPNALHGGFKGFNARTWDVIAETPQALRLHLFSPDGEEGYPGNLHVFVTYALTEATDKAPGGLRIQYEAVTDAPTVVNFTQHTYFNLAGEGAGDVHAHVLSIDADRYAPADSDTCPTGEILPVDGTPMDFRSPTPLGERYDLPFFAPWRGIDSVWVLNRPAVFTPCADEETDLFMSRAAKMRPAAILSCNGLTMHTYTDFPALVVYSGNFVEQHRGKSGSMYDIRHAVCLEAQNLPAAPNFPHFPSAVLRPGELYSHQTVYLFR